jgi:hypothetical protein
MVEPLPCGQYMRQLEQPSIEVHYFPVSADELAERSRNLRTLLLRGARRSIRHTEGRNREDGNGGEIEPLPLDLVEK